MLNYFKFKIPATTWGNYYLYAHNCKGTQYVLTYTVFGFYKMNVH